jgi:hypothetical protein
VRRPDVRSRQVKSVIDRKKQHVEGRDYWRDIYDYKKLMPEAGAPDSLPMKPANLEIVFVRHLNHKDNIVSPEDIAAGKPKLEALIETLNLDNDTEVHLVSSMSGHFAPAGKEFVFNRRTQDTAQVVMDLMDQANLQYHVNDLDGKGSEGVTTLVQNDVKEVESISGIFDQAMREFLANKKAKLADQPLPYPDGAKWPPYIDASRMNLEDLQSKRGVTEVSSATVAKNLEAIERIEHYFVKEKKTSAAKKRVVVMVFAHGQFITNISEALLDITAKKFPIMFADNAGWWKINVGTDDQGQVIEEYVLQSGDKTGLQEKV